MEGRRHDENESEDSYTEEEDEEEEIVTEGKEDQLSVDLTLSEIYRSIVMSVLQRYEQGDLVKLGSIKSQSKFAFVLFLFIKHKV